MTVCNFYPGYLKVRYLTACLTLHQQHVEKENYGQLIAQAPSL
jgi:hypothetical protein